MQDFYFENQKFYGTGKEQKIEKNKEEKGE